MFTEWLEGQTVYQHNALHSKHFITITARQATKFQELNIVTLIFFLEQL
jgi:hypothetical protein